MTVPCRKLWTNWRPAALLGAARASTQHDQVTRVLVEMSAYNVMRLLHELQAERARMVF